MTDIQQSSIPPAPSSNSNTSQSGRAGSPPVAGNALPVASTPAQQQARSYAHATKNSISGPAAQGASNAAGAGNGPSSLVNGRAVASNMASPAIVSSANVNGQTAPSNHSRKPSRTISASGSSGQIPNGGPTTPSARPNISFGSLPTGGNSPAIANSTPQQQSMSVPRPDPRVTTPTASPSPIPQPAASGGRPSLQSQPNALNFGSIGDTEGNRQYSGPQQPPPMPTQNAHFRRASSQSQQPEMGSAGVPVGPSGGRGGYMHPNSGRGRGGYGQAYPPQTSYSPVPNYRPVPGTQRPGSQLHPHFQNQVHIGAHQASPHAQSRSPAPMGSQPGTPQMQQMQVAHGQPMPFAPHYPGYINQLGQQPAPFGMQAQYDPSYSYYAPPYAGQLGYMPPGPPQSPRQFRQIPPATHPAHLQGHYNQPPSQNMSRTSSQVSERPASSLGSAPPPAQPTATPAGSQSSHSHSQSTGVAPTSTSNFTIPRKEKKGIAIKNADGEVMTFDKKPSPSPSIAKSPSPGAASSNATPPPRSSSASSHVRADSKAGKSAAEIKAEFQDQVKKEQERDKQIKEESEVAAPKIEDVAESNSVYGKDTASSEAKPVSEPASVEEPKEEAKADQAGPPAEPGGAAPTGESDEAREKRLKEEEEERMIAEMEAAERKEEERERQFQEKKKKEAAEKATREQQEASREEERMKQAERDAEAAEEARKQEKPQEEESAEAKAERERMFSSLKRSNLGPGAESQAGLETPTDTVPEESMPLPKPAKGAGTTKPKPLPLKLETAKPVEAPQQTPGMRSLKSARMLQLQNEAINYPEGIQSPNPALNQISKRGGRMYDKTFLMQFQDAFKEKPDVDWDKRLKDTLGDPSDSSAPKSARTPSSGVGARTQSHRGHPSSTFTAQAPMGAFANRALPSGTTSDQRFAMSNQGRAVNAPLVSFPPNRAPGFPMPAVNMARQQSMGGGIPAQHHPARAMPSRGSKGGTRADSQKTRKELEKDNQKMPLTATANPKPLEASGSGWKPTSVGRPVLSFSEPNGHMAPDMVQRKVKGNLNKMTPERFEKIADQILTITAQSKDESDGRTLRQVIALTFEKACDEAHWASMYAKFCKRMLEDMTTEIKDENVRDKQGNTVVGGNLFRKYLLNRCQEEFERGWEVNLPMKEEGSSEVAMLSDEYYVAAAAKRKGLGLIQFIGELYKLGMLSIRIMHQCVHRLLDFEGVPEESTVESLTKLLRTVGAQMDMNELGNPYVKSYFDRIDRIMNMEGLPSRMHFMLLDLVDLKNKGWRSKDDSKGPKTIQQIREEALIQQREAELERQRQHQRGGGGRMPSGRNDHRNFSGPTAPPDFAKNTVGHDELRRLGQKAASSRQSSSGPGQSRMGPPSMFPSRAGSGRMGLGPPTGMMGRTSASGDSSPSSGMHSRTASLKPGDKKDEDSKSNSNAFGALADMKPEDADKTPGSSPRVTKAQPASGQQTGEQNGGSTGKSPETGKTDA